MKAEQAKPLDHPTPARPHRLYAALTNSCNRACPWCSTCSSPQGRTFLSPENFLAAIPASGPFEIQLEGGEPTIHPQFWDFVKMAVEHPRRTRLLLCTNGAILPRSEAGLQSWISRFSKRFTLKLSINHYLLERDSGLIDLAKALLKIFCGGASDNQLIFNVRLRRGYDDDDARVRHAVEKSGLADSANVFFLQRYGFAASELTWDEPFLAGYNFSMLNPDGKVFGPALLDRSEAMRALL